MKKGISKIAAAVALFTVAGFANAQSPGISYDNVNLSVEKGEIGDEDFTALVLDGSVSINESVFTYGSYDTAESDDKILGDEVEIDSYAIGLGIHAPLATNTDFVAGVQYLRGNVDYMGFEEDVDGYGLDIGVRSMVTESLELAGFLNYADIEDEDDTSATVSATYYIAPQIGVIAAYTDADETNLYSIGLRYTF